MSLASLPSFSAIYKGVRLIDVPKLAFFAACALLIFGYGVAVGKYSIFPYALLKHVQDSVEQVWSERDTLTGTKPEHFLQPARHAGDGVTVNNLSEGHDELVFLSAFFGDSNALRLIERDGAVVAEWKVSFSHLFPEPAHLPEPPATDWNTDTHGALMLPDGSVVFNFEYGGLVRLDRCGGLVWALPRATHHSVERAEGGGFWVPGRRFHSAEAESPFPPFKPPFAEDTLMKVSADGEVLEEISVPEIFYRNDLEAVLTATGHFFYSGMRWDEEIVHLNKIEELQSDLAKQFPMFGPGDLLLSLRNLNMLMVISPETLEVKWWQIGPWLRQHDPEFTSSGKISVFNNNVFRNVLEADYISAPGIQQVSNIIDVDPATREIARVFGGTRSQRMLSVIRGKHELTAAGGRLVTEFEGGRVFETDATGRIVWEYVNRYNEAEVAEISEARLYPRSYFSVSDWSCPSRSS